MIRTLLLAEAACFAAGAMIHSGFLLPGYEHSRARIAESVIGAVLLGGSVVASVRPALARRVGLAVQGFALLGTLVGMVTIVVGIGPRTLPDVVYHIGLVTLLVWGLVNGRSQGATLG